MSSKLNSMETTVEELSAAGTDAYSKNETDAKISESAANLGGMKADQTSVDAILLRMEAYEKQVQDLKDDKVAQDGKIKALEDDKAAQDGEIQDLKDDKAAQDGKIQAQDSKIAALEDALKDRRAREKSKQPAGAGTSDDAGETPRDSNGDDGAPSGATMSSGAAAAIAVSLLVVLAVGGGGFWWRQHKQQEASVLRDIAGQDRRRGAPSRTPAPAPAATNHGAAELAQRAQGLGAEEASLGAGGVRCQSPCNSNCAKLVVPTGLHRAGRRPVRHLRCRGSQSARSFGTATGFG